MRFILTTHARIPDTVYLSAPGHFGNLPFATDDAATAHARELAAPREPAIDREHFRRRAIPR